MYSALTSKQRVSPQTIALGMECRDASTITDRFTCVAVAAPVNLQKLSTTKIRL